MIALVLSGVLLVLLAIIAALTYRWDIDDDDDWNPW
jgi:hypothetical protein